MKKSQELSLKKLQRLIIISFSLAILVIGGIWMVYSQASLEEQAERMYFKQADMIGMVSKPAMMFADKKLAQVLITQFKGSNGDISKLQIFAGDGEFLAGFPHVNSVPSVASTEYELMQKPIYKGNILKLKRTVFHKELPVGMLYVEFDLSELIGHTRTNLMKILFITLGVFLLILFIVRQLQYKLRASERKLHQAIQQAESANHAKTEFLSTISHELRTPIHGIIGLQQLISADAGNLSDEHRENLRLAQQSAKSLRALVNDVLDLAKIESGKMELIKREFELQHCICDALVPFRLQVIEKGITLSLHIEHAPKMILSDESRLRQILLNLVGNAVKFTDQGEVSLHVIEKRGYLHFMVKDSGIGMSQEDLKHVFDAFSQGSSDYQRKQFGSGLGTSIAKRFVELMGGHIYVESKLGEGSCFFFNIPCLPSGVERIHCDIRSDASLWQSSPTDVNERVVESLSSQLRILLAEDNPIAQRIAKKRLSKAGMDVHIVDNGEDALLQIQKHSYDLLLTDIRMPKLDGLEMTRKIRAMEKESHTSRLPIIGLSAHVLEEVVQDCLSAGMDHFMVKPVDPEVILSTILMIKTNEKH